MFISRVGYLHSDVELVLQAEYKLTVTSEHVMKSKIKSIVVNEQHSFANSVHIVLLSLQFVVVS